MSAHSIYGKYDPGIASLCVSIDCLWDRGMIKSVQSSSKSK